MTPRADGAVTALRIVAIALVLAGVFGLAYSKLTFTEERTAAQVGSVQMTVRTDHHLAVPVWAGVAGIVVGGLLLVGTMRGARA